MDPPAHDSPNNILNALIDDCIEHIFRRILRLEDYLNMAQVCKRFQKSAQNCFSTQFQSVCLYRFAETKGNIANSMIPSTQTFELLNTFGPSIQELRFKITPNQQHDDEIFNSVVEYCNRTLKKLHINGLSRTCTIDVKEKFPALKVLHLYHVSVMNFDHIIHALEELQVAGIDSSCFIREIPRLKWIQLSEPYYGPNYITDDMLSKFVQLNPQLQYLRLWACNNLTPMILRHIGENSVSLVKLILCDLRLIRTSSLLNMYLPYLGSLNQLQFLEIQLNSTNSFETMINTFAKDKVPIESIKLGLFIRENQSIHACCNLKTIPTLKHFVIGHFENRNLFNENEMLVNFLRKQSALETIKILCRDENPISMINVRNMLTYGSKLTKFKLLIGILEFNSEIYESVLSLVKNRTRVKIVIGNQRSQCIPEGVSMNNEWLEVRYFKGTDREGVCMHSLN